MRAEMGLRMERPETRAVFVLSTQQWREETSSAPFGGTFPIVEGF